MEPDALPRINRVMLSGFIQQDPELRFTPGGVAVASFRLRTARLLPESRGAGREVVSYVTVVAWQELAQRVSREGKNGQAVFVEGFLHTRSFATQRGERRTVVEVYADQLQLMPVFMAPGSDAPAPAPRREPRRAGNGGRSRAPEEPRLPLSSADGPSHEPMLDLPVVEDSRELDNRE